MVNLLFILGFAVSSSLDNLGVGISYGIRGIRIGFLSNLVMAVICFLFSEAGILFGQWIMRLLPGVLPVLIGSFVLAVIGVRIVLLAMPRKATQEKQLDSISDEPAAKPARSVQEILKNPETADADKSGHIGLGEAVLLGAALSANAVTNGLSAGMFGLSPLAISLTAAAGSFLTVWFGVYFGRKVSGVRIGSFTLGQFGTLISGVILLVVAGSTFLG